MQINIRYKNDKYLATWKGALEIQVLRLALFTKRKVRCITRNLLFCRGALMILPLWFVFCLLVFLWGIKIGAGYSVMDMLWEIKYSIFTSVIVVAFMAVINGNHRHKNSFLIQHLLYTDLLSLADDIWNEVFERQTISCSSEVEYHCGYDIALYTQDRLARVQKILSTMEIKSGDECQHMKELSEQLKICLQKIKQMVLEDKLFLKSQDATIEKIEDLLSGRNEEPRFLANGVVPEKYELSAFLERMFSLVEDIRRPWRRDIVIDEKIRTLLLKNDAGAVFNHYYMCLFLNISNLNKQNDRVG